MIDDRKECTLLAAMKSVMREKQVWRRKKDPLSQQPLNGKFFASCQNSFEHIAVQKDKREDEEEVPRAASCASASLRRGKDFPVTSKDTSDRAQCQAKETGKLEK